ncbi:MAG: patatin-like phospholipase family protein [Spirochaetales bacterium]|nr:patatin-like phospholipase family protein [Spirochaetales bacterium]
MKNLKSSILLLILFISTTLYLNAQSNRHIGLCLAAGGNKAAYQVGVWKYLCESGKNKTICGISGASMSAVNAALFAGRTAEDVQKIWEDVLSKNPTLALDISMTCMIGNATSEYAETIGQIYEATKSNVNSKSEMVLNTAKDSAVIGSRAVISFIKDSFWKYLGTQDKVEGLYERDELTKILNQYIKPDAIQNVKYDIYAAAIRKEKLAIKSVSGIVGNTATIFRLRDQKSSADDIVNILMASSATPFAFTTVTLSDKVVDYNKGKPKEVGKQYEYLDGGFGMCGGKYLSIDPLLNDKNVYEIIVVYLDSAAKLGLHKLDGNKMNKNIIEIVPSMDLDMFTNSKTPIDKSKIHQLIELGYSDAKTIFTNIDSQNDD